MSSDAETTKTPERIKITMTNAQYALLSEAAGMRCLAMSDLIKTAFDWYQSQSPAPREETQQRETKSQRLYVHVSPALYRLVQTRARSENLMMTELMLKAVALYLQINPVTTK